MSAAKMGLLAAATLATLARGIEAQGIGIAIGSPAPPAVVETLDGKATDLDDFIGRTPVLIEFWSTWCSYCEELEPAIKAVHSRYGDRLTIIGVAIAIRQSRASVRRYVDRHALPGVQVFDRFGKAAAAYAVPGSSYIVVLDASGTVVYTGIGGRQDVEAAVQRALEP